MRTIRWGGLASCLVAASVCADPLNELDYQGKVLLNDLPFTGNGHFKFTITDVGNTSNYWANDASGAGEPAAHVTNAVFNGVFSTLLGAVPMTAINSGIFNSGADLYLRVWFSTATTGFSAMLPAQKIVSSAYSINAGKLGGQSVGQVQTNAVNAATNAITLAGDVTGLPHANSIAPGVIVDADVNAAAAIAGTKVVAGTTVARGTLQLATGTTGTTAIGTGHPFLNAFSTVNSIVASAPNSGFGIVGSNNVLISVAGTNVVVNSPFMPNLDNVVWVATNGTAAGPGTADRPYNTPQAGYDAAAARYGTAPSVVAIAGGVYGTGLIMSSGSVHVIGFHRPQMRGLTVSAAPVPAISGYQNVEGVVVSGAPMMFSPTGARVRFHNCRFTDGVVIISDGIIFQNCYITVPGGPAMAIATMPFTGAGFIGVYQSSIRNADPTFGAIEIGLATFTNLVQGLEVIGCEIVNSQGVSGPAIRDLTTHQFTSFPIKLFAHNYIKGPPPAPSPGYGPPAIADPLVIFPFPPLSGAFLGFYNNTIYGHVGSVIGGVAHPQWHANNMVYGVITFPVAPPGSLVGWLQAGAGLGADAFGNIQHEAAFPVTVPNLWND